jgi:penicillin-binding protein 1A
VTGVWVGGDERSIRFPNWSFGAGTKSARPIWDKYMVKVYRNPKTGYPKGMFKRPSKLDIPLDCMRYNRNETEETEQTVDDHNEFDPQNF